MPQMNMQDMLGMTPEQMEIARKTRYAETLRRKSEEPMEGQMVSGHYVPPSWTQGLAKMLSAYGSGKMERDAAEAAKAYGEKQRTDFTDTASKYAEALRGTPEQQTPYQADNPFGEDLGNLQTVTPAQVGDPNQALAIAMQSRSPQWQQFGMAAQLKRATQTPSEQFGKIMPHAYTPDSLALYQQTGNYADLKPIAGGRDFGKVNPGQFTPESLARYAESGHIGDLVPFRAPVQIDQGDRKTLYDPGTRGTRSFDVAPPPEAMPTHKGAQAKAEAEAKAEVASATDSKSKNKNADSLLSNITEAEKILNQGKATGSLVGTGLAKVKGVVGKSDASTQANQDLKLISGWMVANVPRMEGPQSNFDVQNYREMAAMVGDMTIPVGDRLSALKQLRKLQEKYKDIQSGNTSQPTNRPNLDSLWD